MSNKFKNNLILILIILIIMVMIGVYIHPIKSNGSAASYSKNGTLNLENWDWVEKKIIVLNGEWNYYPDLLMQEIDAGSTSLIKMVPHFWEKDADLNYSPYGFGTYMLQIKGLKSSGIYGFEILDEVTAYRLSANNIPIASNGIVDKERSTYLPQWLPVQGIFQADDNGKVEFTMEIANFDYNRGGFWNCIKIGNVEDILDEVYKDKILDMFLFASVFIVGLLNIALFFIYQREKTTLYFALFCFCMSIRTLLIGQRLISDIIPISNWYTMLKMEYISGYLLLPIWGLFFISLFGSYAHPIIQERLFKIFIIGCSALVLFMPISIYTAFLEQYKWISILFILYFAYLTTKAIIERHSGAKLMLIAAFGMIVALVKEIFIGGTMSWMPFGTLIFVVCFSLITFQRFLRVIRENEILGTKVILDPLTGLYNRTYLMEFENDDSFTQKDQNKYLMFLDLDCFKEINDTYGHKIGDYILKETGQRLRSTLRKTDVICRYGGDEFVIILDDQLEDIKNIAERIIKTIQEPFKLDENIYNISASIGISKFDVNPKNMEAYIRKSDEAMYEAKRNGGSQYFIYQSS